MSYYSENAERIKKRTAAYYAKNKEAQSIKSRERYQRNREKILVQRKEYRDSNKERIAISSRNYHLKKTYGIDVTKYEELLKAQNYCCAICRISEEKLNTKLHIDHDHSSGKVRGLLCNPCNRAIGLLHDDIKVIESAVKYLEETNE